jgi:hypothetical protein
MAYASEYVENGISAGDPLSVMRRMKVIENMTRFPETSKTKTISELLILGGGLTSRAERAAEHIACAALHRSEILLTWNCRDIANAEKLALLRMLMISEDLQLPELVTPFELMENSYEDLWQGSSSRFGNP